MHRLDKASEALGIDLWIKRDDLTGFAFGGNKTRKLEFLIAQLLACGADTVVTCGSIQSNFVRQLGAACAMFGIRCVAVVMNLPFEDVVPGGIRLNGWHGNPQLDAFWGVELRVLPDGRWDELFQAARETAAELKQQGALVTEIPVGGSSELGAYAFFEAGQEVRQSGRRFDWIVTSSSSGSTQTGLTYQFHGQRERVLGFSADPEPEFIHDLCSLGRKLAQLLGVPALVAGDFLLNHDFVGAGYGVTDLETLSAARRLAELEGIVLDPIYGAKAFNGLATMARRGEIGGEVLFWHTGGGPAFFGLEPWPTSLPEPGF